MINLCNATTSIKSEDNPSVASRQLPLGKGADRVWRKNGMVAPKFSLPLEGKGDHAVVDEV